MVAARVPLMDSSSPATLPSVVRRPPPPRSTLFLVSSAFLTLLRDVFFIIQPGDRAADSGEFFAFPAFLISSFQFAPLPARKIPTDVLPPLSSTLSPILLRVTLRDFHHVI